LTLVLELTPTPPANAFVGEDQVDDDQPVYPLDVFFCENCGHVQLLDVVDPEILFSDYVYVSGTSPVFVDHFRTYADDIVSQFNVSKDGLAIDIGSNDGTLLGFFKKMGLSVLGIDPAKNIAEAATKQGIETWIGFFDQASSERILKERGPASIITANNVFAHADNLAEITQGIRHLLTPDGIFVFEVSYLGDVVRKTLFDTIYHEHLSYHSVGPLVRFFEEQGLEMIHAEHVGSHGGSLRGVCQLAGGPKTIDETVGKLLEQESVQGLDKAETFISFADDIQTKKHKLTEMLSEIKKAGHTIGAYGAPAKATTLMYHFGLGKEEIDFIVDDSPLKQNSYSPGLHVPVVGSDAIAERKPDYLVILAWNFADSIIEKGARFRASGGKYIIPLPEVKVT